MAELHVVGDWGGPGEERTARRIAAELPATWSVVANRDVPSGHGTRQIDLIAVGNNLVFVLEEKNWGPRVEIHENYWRVKDEQRPNPYNQAQQSARVLAGRLRERVPGWSSAARAMPKGSFLVRGHVILSHQSLELIDDDLPGAPVLGPEAVITLSHASATLLELDKSSSSLRAGLRRTLLDYLTESHLACAMPPGDTAASGKTSTVTESPEHKTPDGSHSESSQRGAVSPEPETGTSTNASSARVVRSLSAARQQQLWEWLEKALYEHYADYSTGVREACAELIEHGGSTAANMAKLRLAVFEDNDNKYKKKRPAEARRLYLELLDAGYRRPLVLNNLASMATSRDERRKLYRQAAEVASSEGVEHDQHVRAKTGLARLELEAGVDLWLAFYYAKWVYDHSAGVSRVDGAMWCVRALGALREYDQARRWYEEAEMTRVPWLVVELGDLELAAGDPAQARVFYEQGGVEGERRLDETGLAKRRVPAKRWSLFRHSQ